MATKKYSLADAINIAYGNGTRIITRTKNLLTKREFGKLVHDPTVPEEEKLQLVKEMKEAGGYEGLPED